MMARLLLACSLAFCLCDSYIIQSQRGQVKTFKLHRIVSNVAHSFRTSAFAVNARNKDDDDFIPPPPPSSGKGEWADWDTDSFVEEPYEPVVEEVDEEEEIVLSAGFDAIIAERSSSSSSSASSASSGQWSPLSTGDKGGAQGMSAADNWPGWSEEAPYFDEDDTQDDEGNWGRAEGTEKPGYGAVSGSSDLWTRQTPDTDDFFTPPYVPGEFNVASAVTSAVTADVPSPTAVVPIVAVENVQMASNNEVNSRILALEMSVFQNSIDRKMDLLTREVSDLKTLYTNSLLANTELKSAQTMKSNIDVKFLLASCVPAFIVLYLTK